MKRKSITKRKKSTRRKGKKIHKNFYKIMIVVFALLSLDFFMGIGGIDGLYQIYNNKTDEIINRMVSNSDNSKYKTDDLITISPQKLRKDYLVNAVTANEMYRDKPIGILARVSRIDADQDGLAIVVLNWTFNPKIEVVAIGGKQFTNQAATLKRGESVVFTCLGDGATADIPRLRDCSLVTDNDKLG